MWASIQYPKMTTRNKNKSMHKIIWHKITKELIILNQRFTVLPKYAINLSYLKKKNNKMFILTKSYAQV